MLYFIILIVKISSKIQSDFEQTAKRAINEMIQHRRSKHHISRAGFSTYAEVMNIKHHPAWNCVDGSLNNVLYCSVWSTWQKETFRDLISDTCSLLHCQTHVNVMWWTTQEKKKRWRNAACGWDNDFYLIKAVDCYTGWTSTMNVFMLNERVYRLF